MFQDSAGVCLSSVKTVVWLHRPILHWSQLHCTGYGTPQHSPRLNWTSGVNDLQLYIHCCLWHWNVGESKYSDDFFFLSFFFLLLLSILTYLDYYSLPSIVYSLCSLIQVANWEQFTLHSLFFMLINTNWLTEHCLPSIVYFFMFIDTGWLMCGSLHVCLHMTNQCFLISKLISLPLNRSLPKACSMGRVHTSALAGTSWMAHLSAFHLLISSWVSSPPHHLASLASSESSDYCELSDLSGETIS